MNPSMYQFSFDVSRFIIRINNCTLYSVGWNWKFGKSTYYWSKEQRLKSTWDSARISCQLLGKASHLVKIETKEENDYLKKQFGGYDSWIGLSDVEREGTFRWVDGSLVGFSYWYPGKPNNSGQNEDCVYIENSYNNMWNDAPCTINMYFICEREN